MRSDGLAFLLAATPEFQKLGELLQNPVVHPSGVFLEDLSAPVGYHVHAALGPRDETRLGHVGERPADATGEYCRLAAGQRLQQVLTVDPCCGGHDLAELASSLRPSIRQRRESWSHKRLVVGYRHTWDPSGIDHAVRLMSRPHLDARNLGGVQEIWPHKVVLERDFHDDILRIGDSESDIELRLPPLQDLRIGR